MSSIHVERGNTILPSLEELRQKLNHNNWLIKVLNFCYVVWSIINVTVINLIHYNTSWPRGKQAQNIGAMLPISVKN